MKTKLNKSIIKISGRIFIERFDFEKGQFIGDSIELEGLKQAKSGIYEIRNKFNNKRYIGKSEDLVARKKHHQSDIYLHKHKSKEMQDDYESVIQYEGGFVEFDDVFEFNVIHYCYSSELEFWERTLIDNIHPEYNTKKKKQIPPKIFDIDGNKITFGCDPDSENIPNLPSHIYNPETKTIDTIYNGKVVDKLGFVDDDCEDEMM